MIKATKNCIHQKVFTGKAISMCHLQNQWCLEWFSSVGYCVVDWCIACEVVGNEGWSCLVTPQLLVSLYMDNLKRSMTGNLYDNFPISKQGYEWWRNNDIPMDCVRNKYVSVLWIPELHFNIKTILPGIWLGDHVIFNGGIHLQVSQHLYIEMTPCCLDKSPHMWLIKHQKL